MFTVNDRDFLVEQERRNEEQRQAAHRALVREARAANPVPPSRFERVLAGAGNWLVNQGRRLENRYGEAEKPIAITDTQHAGTR
jgi:hypothetical protein